MTIMYYILLKLTENMKKDNSLKELLHQRGKMQLEIIMKIIAQLPAIINSHNVLLRLWYKMKIQLNAQCYSSFYIYYGKC